MAAQPVGGNTPVNPYPAGSLFASAFDQYGPLTDLPPKPKTQDYVNSLAQLLGPQGSVDPQREQHIKECVDKIKSGVEEAALWHQPPPVLPPEVASFMQLNEGSTPVDPTNPVIVPVDNPPAAPPAIVPV